MGIESYSTTAESNTSLFPEGQDPGTVNNGMRQLQADLAAFYQDLGWYRPGNPAYTHEYLSATSFRVAGVNVASLYHTSRRVRATGALTGTVYGTISAVSFSGGNTNVTVTWDSGSLINETLTVSLSIQPRSDQGGWGISSSSVPTASDAVAGIVELATSAETIAGTDLLRAVTPAALAALTALDSRRGLVELATNAEVLTGTDTERAVTPAALANRSATDARTGLVELATSTEAFTGTDTARVLTPAAFSAFSFKNTVGYIGLPGQWVINFGINTSLPSSTKTVSYARSYTTAVYAVLVSPVESAWTPSLTLVGTSTFGVNFYDSSYTRQISNFYWLAIGY